MYKDKESIFSLITEEDIHLIFQRFIFYSLFSNWDWKETAF